MHNPPQNQRIKSNSQEVAGHFRVVSLATSISRVSGFFRDQLNSWIFGAGLISDSYFAALRIPNLLRDLFAEGALSASFIPTLSKSLEKEKAEETWALISQVFTLLFLIVGIVVALGIFAAPLIVEVVAPGFQNNPDKFQLTVSLTRVLFPVLLFVSMAALWMGTLNAHNRFAIPAFAPVAMNATLILAGLYLFFGPSQSSGNELRKIYIWTGATTFGFALQWLIQLPSTRGLGGTFRFAWPPSHPGIKDMLFLIAPAVVSLSVTQMDFLLNQIFASFLQNGSITCLNYGNRLMQLPYGVFGVSIATVIFPLMSRQWADGDKIGFDRTLNQAIETAAFIMIPSSVGLCLVSLPICRLAFEHGHFNETATRFVAEATILYSIGLFAHAGIKITAQAFYPLKQPRWPFWAAVVNMVSTALLNLTALLYLKDPHLKFLALPLATTVGVFFTFLFLCYGLHHYGAKWNIESMIVEFSKIIGATFCMSIGTYGTLHLLEQIHLPGNEIWEVFLPILIGVGIYWISAYLMGCRSLHWVINRKKNKLPG